MQLRLTIAVAALAALAGRARAQAVLGEDSGSVSAAVHYYADDDDVSVVSSGLVAHAPVGRVMVDVAADVDAVTAASIDVVSNASPHPFDELRLEGGAGVTWPVSTALRLRGRIVGSTEHDYRSLHLGTGLRLDLAHHDSTLDVDYTAAIDRVGKQGEPSFSKPHGQHRLALAFTQVLGQRTYGDLVVDAELTTGFQASAYRYVPIVDQAGNRLYVLPERVPERRVGAAALARVRRALGEHWTVHGDYRFYGDSWGVTSHTLSALAMVALAGGQLTVGAEARAYLQSAARFYRASYQEASAGAPAWRTRDRALGGVRTLAGGLVADLSAAAGGDGAHAFASFELMRFSWLDFPLQAGRTAAVTSLGLELPF